MRVLWARCAGCWHFVRGPAAFRCGERRCRRQWAPLWPLKQAPPRRGRERAGGNFCGKNVAPSSLKDPPKLQVQADEWHSQWRARGQPLAASFSQLNKLFKTVTRIRQLGLSSLEQRFLLCRPFSVPLAFGLSWLPPVRPTNGVRCQRWPFAPPVGPWSPLGAAQ